MLRDDNDTVKLNKLGVYVIVTFEYYVVLRYIKSGICT